ncbi:MAG TPA: hypothetical protein VEF04_03820 [Blastocatellia bacterium]|nr:hypothetical protein [Blastocatellia bacterium]
MNALIEVKPQSNAPSVVPEPVSKPIPSKREEKTPQPGEIFAVPIIRKPGIPSAPQGKKIETKKDSEKKTTAPPVSRPQMKMPPPQKYPDAPQPFFTSIMPAQKNKQHNRLVLVTILMLLATIGVFVLAYYAMTKAF